MEELENFQDAAGYEMGTRVYLGAPLNPPASRPILTRTHSTPACTYPKLSFMYADSLPVAPLTSESNLINS